MEIFVAIVIANRAVRVVGYRCSISITRSVPAGYSQADPATIHRQVLAAQDVAAGHPVEMLHHDCHVAVRRVKVSRVDSERLALWSVSQHRAVIRGGNDSTLSARQSRRGAEVVGGVPVRGEAGAFRRSDPTPFKTG